MPEQTASILQKYGLTPEEEKPKDKQKSLKHNIINQAIGAVFPVYKLGIPKETDDAKRTFQDFLLAYTSPAVPTFMQSDRQKEAVNKVIGSPQEAMSRVRQVVVPEPRKIDETDESYAQRMTDAGMFWAIKTGTLGKPSPMKDVGKTKRLPSPEVTAKAHVIAKDKGYISPQGKPKPQYRSLAKAMTNKSSMKDMTPEEAKLFTDSLERLPEPTIKGGKVVPPSIPKTKELTTEGYFEKVFKKPTPVRLMTSQSRYAELLGVKEFVKPFEVGKMQKDLEYGHFSNQIDKATKKLSRSKRPEMARMLNTMEEAPPELKGKEREVFDYFRSLTRDALEMENAVRVATDRDPIKGIDGYFRHIADKMSDDVVSGRYAPPEGAKYWSQKVVSKNVFNPMELKRQLKDNLLKTFSDDLPYVMKSMMWTALDEVHFAQPKKFLSRALGAVSKDKAVYKNLSPKEKALYDAQTTMPAATKKWLIDYTNTVLLGKQTALDESVNLWMAEPVRKTLNAIMKPFGKVVSQKPITNMISNFSKLPIYGVMGGVNPRQIIRNKMQTMQSMALYGVKNTMRGYLPTNSYPTLEKLKTDSLFKKSYSGFEDMPAKLRSKIERIGLAPYQWSALSNVSQAMNSAYHWTADKIQNPKAKHLGWADPKRTYKEPKDFFYPSELEKLTKEMEYGAHTTQYQYIGMGMPEVFRYKSLSGITRLQSWWMNHYFIFHREAATRLFTGHTGYDKNTKVPWGDRMNYLKYLVIGGVVLNSLGYGRSYLFGAAPTSLPPTAQLVLGFYNYFTNMGDEPWQKQKRLKAQRDIVYALKTFIPGYLSVTDLAKLIKGEKHWSDYLFYNKGKKKEAVSSYLSGGLGGSGSGKSEAILKKYGLN
jgi:hypothetical protein